MTEAQVILEYRQICELEDARKGKPETVQTYADGSYEQELRDLGIAPEMMEQLRG